MPSKRNLAKIGQGVKRFFRKAKVSVNRSKVIGRGSVLRNATRRSASWVRNNKTIVGLGLVGTAYGVSRLRRDGSDADVMFDPSQDMTGNISLTDGISTGPAGTIFDQDDHHSHLVHINMQAASKIKAKLNSMSNNLIMSNSGSYRGEAFSSLSGNSSRKNLHELIHYLTLYLASIPSDDDAEFALLSLESNVSLLRSGVYPDYSADDDVYLNIKLMELKDKTSLASLDAHLEYLAEFTEAGGRLGVA